MSALRWHLFCRVVDNYGDAGVAWRLARQLRVGADAVTLFVDDLHVLGRIESRVDVACERQRIDDVAVCAYASHDGEDPGDVVVSVFGSEPSTTYRSAMADRRPAPHWIDLEYLSAEDWVVEFHGLPSPDPRSSLVKHFFYPGFVDGTGGLGVEPDLDRSRTRFVEDADARHRFAARLGLPDDGSRLASLFAYPSAPVDALLDAIAAGAERWTVCVPEGVATAAIERRFGGARGSTLVDRALTVRIHPFVSQDDYDRLLWLCDVAFVRGEDSFVRAQCAGLPFVWQPYPQAERAQDVKRRAFETLHQRAMTGPARAAQRALWRAWNDPGGDVGDAWRAWRAEAVDLATHARAWRDELASRSPLVVRLRDWVASRRGDLLN